MLHMIIEVTIMMLVAYLFGWVLGMNFRTLGDDGLRRAVEADAQAPGGEGPAGS